MRIALILLSITALISFLYGLYALGAHSVQAKWDIQISNDKAHVASIQKQSAIIQEKIVTVYVDKIKTIQTKGKDREIYIDKIIDSCPLSTEFVRLYNSAILDSSPEDKGGTADITSQVSSTDLLHNANTNYTTCNKEIAKLSALQEAVKSTMEITK